MENTFSVKIYILKHFWLRENQFFMRMFTSTAIVKRNHAAKCGITIFFKCNIYNQFLPYNHTFSSLLVDLPVENNDKINKTLADKKVLHHTDSFTVLQSRNAKMFSSPWLSFMKIASSNADFRAELNNEHIPIWNFVISENKVMQIDYMPCLYYLMLFFFKISLFL